MRLQLWDTAGQERFRSLTSNFFGRADGFILTYDISNRPSFDHVIGWMRDIKTRAPPECDIVLCGNKCDLDNDRVVQYEEGKQLADEYGVQFFETSALTGHDVEPMFTALATTIKRKRIDDYEKKHGNNSSNNNNTNTNHQTSSSTGGTRGMATDSGGTVNLAAGGNGGGTSSSDPSSTKSKMCCQ